MLLRWQRWNRLAKIALLIITVIGVVAAIPLGIERMAMEKTSKHIEYVFDYRDIVEVAELQPHPQAFIDEQLALLKEAGITTMAVYESSLRELMQSGRLMYYNEKDAALLQGILPDERVNFTYILFNRAEDEEQLAPILTAAFDRYDIVYRPWSYGGRNGIVVETPLTDAGLKTLDFDPIALQSIHAAGFHILPRFSDRVPYDAEAVESQLIRLKEFGVTRLLFDGDKVKGASDQKELNSLNSFGELLNQYDIGLTTIENLKKQQQGINKLSYITDYNIVRLYSLSPEESITMTKEGIVDRFLLAAKDRNIRMFFLNTMAQSKGDEGRVIHSVDKLSLTMSGEDGVVATLADAGFPAGEAQPFAFNKPSWEKPLRGVVALGAVAMIALLVGAFIPNVLIPVFLIGVLGSAGLLVKNSSLMEQALALGAAVSAPTLGLIWVMNRIYSRTIGERRAVGGEEWSIGGTALDSDSKTKWVFPGLSIGRSFGLALNWFIVATLISLSAVPLVFGLLNNITYSLVLEQFRGVSALHFGPIILVAIYVFLYNGQNANGVLTRTRKLLSQPITVVWVIVAAFLGAVGMYYLSRTGNAGQVSSIELFIRGWLESNFGVRPRFKEFMLGHPPLLLGLFLALRYRAAWLLIIVGSIGQLTMVGTFTHIHSPLYISTVRTLLGLGAGVLIGCLLIVAWLVVEGVWRKWLKDIIRKPIA